MVFKKTLCIGFSCLMLWGMFGCTQPPAVAAPVAEVSESAAPTAEPVSLTATQQEPEAEQATPIPTPEPTPVVTATPTPTPSPTPVPTREPMEGDFVLEFPESEFPDYDTGVDADYSYQSDELRVAIRTVVDEDNAQQYYVADVWIRNISAFRTGFGHGAYRAGWEEPVSFAVRENAIFAVNGSANSGVVFHNGKWYKGTARTSDGEGLMCMYTDGTMRAVNLLDEKFDYRKENAKKPILNIWHVGPSLVHEGEIVDTHMTRARHPRTIIGYYAPGHYVVVVVDGRRKNAIGMTDMEMAEMMHDLGVQEAVNLDGGDSTYMVFMGEIINSPSSVDKNNDGTLDRKVFDMILFAEYDSDGDAPALEDVDMSKVRIKADEE